MAQKKKKAPARKRPPLKLFVAVHGIGDQTQFETIRNVANRCFGTAKSEPALPLGYLHSKLQAFPPEYDAYFAPTPDPKLAWAEVPSLPDTAFAEVFWADIARAHEEYTQEAAGSWIDTIVGRVKVNEETLLHESPPDEINYDLIRRVLEHMGSALNYIGHANTLMSRLRVGQIDLKGIYSKFLGDVQLFAEYGDIRSLIMDRFHAVMDSIETRAKGAGRDVEIHLIAHSLGSTVSFLGLLEGYHRRRPWVKRIKSYMTFGSPIDKFLVLWPSIWQPPKKAGAGRAVAPNIRWFNYADKGDPVGYELDTARDFVAATAPGLFEQGAPQDFVFGRYPMPGKAHVDYWEDQPLWDHYFDEAARWPVPKAEPTPAPTTEWWKRLVSWGITYDMALLFYMVAAYFFVQVAHDGSGRAPGIWQVIALGALLAGTSIFASISRATRDAFWLVPGALGFGAGCWIFHAGMSAGGAVGWLTPTIVIAGALAVAQNTIDRFWPRVRFWWVVVAVGVAWFVRLQWDQGFMALASNVLPLLAAFVFWGLAILLWDLAVIWQRYVGGSTHMQFLRKRWGNSLQDKLKQTR